MRDETAESPTRTVTDVVRDTALAGGVRVSELTATGEHGLARVAGLVALTDFAAIYLALGAGLDPLRHRMWRTCATAFAGDRA